MSIEVNIKHDKEFQPKVTEKYISFENSKGEKIRINLPENSNVTTISEEEINLIMDNYKIIKPDYIKMREEEISSEIEEIPEEETSNETKYIDEEAGLTNENNDKLWKKKFASCFLIPIIPTVLIGSIACFILKFNIAYITCVNAFLYLFLVLFCMLLISKAYKRKENKYTIQMYICFLILFFTFFYLIMYCIQEKGAFEVIILTGILLTGSLTGMISFYLLNIEHNKK